MSKPFLVDAVSGKEYSYEQLIGELNEPDQAVPHVVRNSDTYVVFKAYVQALIFERRVVLLDHDFSEDEIAGLPESCNGDNQPAHCRLNTPISDLPDLVSRLRAAKDAEFGFFTSGTTGLPKRVNHNVRNLARAVRLDGQHANDVWAFAYDPTHIAGCQVFLQAVLNGATLVNVFGLARDEIYEALRRNNVSHISATPTFYRLLMPADRVVESVCRVTFGGERMDASLQRELKQVFPNAKFLNVYASTEAGTMLAAQGEVFSIRQGLEHLVKINDDQVLIHRQLLGEFVGKSIEGEWYETGDMVEVVANSPLRFKIINRETEMINVGGYKVNPLEVEEVIRTHPQVGNVRVYGVKNSVTGNLVCCDIVPEEGGFDEQELRQHLTQFLQPFKIPRIYNPVKELKLTKTGKLKRS